MSADRVTITGLRVRGHHGVYDAERRAGQDFVVDATLELDVSAAAASDDVTDTVDYGTLAETLAAVVAGEPVNLVETLATRLAAVCLRDARVAAATVTVHKPQAPVRVQLDDVSVTVRRPQAGTTERGEPVASERSEPVATKRSEPVTTERSQS